MGKLIGNKTKTRSPRKTAKLESDIGNGPLGSVQVQGCPRPRFLVRVTSIRKRLIDEDNLCEKYHVDLLRYSGAISGDEAATTKIETTQIKAAKGEEEKTLIEVEDYYQT